MARKYRKWRKLAREIDWSLPDRVLAPQLGITVQALRYARDKYGKRGPSMYRWRDEEALKVLREHPEYGNMSAAKAGEVIGWSYKSAKRLLERHDIPYRGYGKGQVRPERARKYPRYAWEDLSDYAWETRTNPEIARLLGIPDPHSNAAVQRVRYWRRKLGKPPAPTSAGEVSRGS